MRLNFPLTDGTLIHADQSLFCAQSLKNMTKYSVSVPSIGCDGCITTLAEVLTHADATAEVSGDAASKQLWVDTCLTEAQITAVVIDAGHEVAAINPVII